MESRIIRLFIFLIFFVVIANNSYGFASPCKDLFATKYLNADVDSSIIKSLDDMNKMLATKDLQKIMSVFEDGEDIMLVGSDSGEVYIGREQIEEFFKMIVSLPFVFSFEMNILSVNQINNTGWFFGEGKMIHTRPDGKVTFVPYRITAILVKKGNEWKWKVFSGAIPRGE